MKKIIISITILSVFLLIYYFNNNDTKHTKVTVGSFNLLSSIKLLNKNIDKLNSKLNDNPITVGIYINRKLMNNYTTSWTKNVDLGVFSVFATNQSSIPKTYFQADWKKYWNSYDNIDQYKIGYHISFKDLDGNIIEKTILSPSDTPFLYQYMQVYLYDDVNQIPGAWYSHVTTNQYTSKTILTSIKLTGSNKTNEITSPITLTAFTYDGKEDFFSTNGNYIGKSTYTTIINKK